MVYLLAFFSILLSSFAQVFFKYGVSVGSFTAISLMLNRYIWLGVFSYLVSLILWLYVLRQLPVSVAYPLTSAGYIFILFLALPFFHEPITVAKVVAIFFIIVGIVIIGMK